MSGKAKGTANTTPRSTLGSPQHCTNCGHVVFGYVAVLAADPAVRFCCFCGSQLDGGKCSNNACTYGGQVPPCP